MVEQDKRREDEWFLANEKKLLETARIEREKREKERAAQRGGGGAQAASKDQHFMRCPKCGHEMREEALEGVKIDRCSFCEGIYFDAGELDQVLLKREDDRRGFFRKLVKI